MCSIEEKIGKVLLLNNLTISTAESCTGGMVASKLISYPGISKIFKEGFVTYTEEAKMKRLGVKRVTLEKHTVVSFEVAEEMAIGVSKAALTDIGISTTGIAGPGGGSPEQPVGLVYIGLYYKGETYSKKLLLKGDRQKIREEATIKALELLEEIVNSNFL